MTLLLTRAEAEPLLDIQQAIEVTRQALLEQHNGTVVASAPRHVQVRKGGALRIVSGALLGMERMGARLGPAAALASSRGTALLYDAQSGDLLSIMGYPFGTLRTGATVGLATQLLARDDAHELAMIGTGRNALSLLSAVCAVRPIQKVSVYSRTPEHREKFVRSAESQLPCTVVASPDARSATCNADVVCVATDSASPVVENSQLKPGAFLATMGKPSEIDESIYRAAARVIVGNKKQEEEYFDARHFTHRLLDLTRAGELNWNDVSELCDVVAGTRPGRSSSRETIVFKESQGGFGDVAFANYVYQRAQQQGVGRNIDID